MAFSVHLRTLQFVFDGGESAAHETGKQPDYGKRKNRQQLLHGKKAEKQSQNHSYTDRQKEQETFFELLEQISHGIEKLIVQLKDDRYGRAADSRNNDRQSDKKTEKSALAPCFSIILDKGNFQTFLRHISSLHRQIYFRRTFSLYHAFIFHVNHYFLFRGEKAKNYNGKR